MQPHYFPNAPPNTIARHRSAQRPFDAEAEAALRQIIRFHKHGEVGTRTALPVTVNSIEVRLAHEFACGARTCVARILLPLVSRP